MAVVVPSCARGSAPESVNNTHTFPDGSLVPVSVSCIKTTSGATTSGTSTHTHTVSLRGCVTSVSHRTSKSHLLPIYKGCQPLTQVTSQPVMCVCGVACSICSLFTRPSVCVPSSDRMIVWSCSPFSPDCSFIHEDGEKNAFSHFSRVRERECCSISPNPSIPRNDGPPNPRVKGTCQPLDRLSGP